MKPEAQIKALAELGGFEIAYGEACVIRPDKQGDPEIVEHYPIQKYLTSYDAIIPLIQKQPEWTKGKLCGHLFWQYGKARGEESPRKQLEADMKIVLLCTPAQLSEALLRATGKWVEE